MKVYTVSDIHVDYPENMEWILSLDSASFLEDILIVAGDVSHDLQDLSRVFSSLVTKFKSVHFIPGNHELWIEQDKYDCSLEKFDAVQRISNEHGVQTKACHYGKLSLVPLHSWYDFSFGEPDRHLNRAWRDFRACAWPSELENVKDINEYFLSLNREHLTISNDTVISYSHFLPRIDVMPSFIPEDRRRIYPVLGSDLLGDQVRHLNPDIHIYGHSHVNQSVELDNIRYVNNAFAYPTENRISRKELHCVTDLDL
ncbi:MAG: metallophosphoesterase [Pseudomonadales bacterium]|nr:metallophosphoesterase [Pseudomonadales bacterium]